MGHPRRSLILMLALAATLLIAPGARIAAGAAAGAPPGAQPAELAPVPRAVRRELDRAERLLRHGLKSLPPDSGVTIVRERERVVLRAPARLLFDPDEATVRSDPEATTTLQAAAALLRKRHALQAQVRVYSDSLGGNGINAAFTKQRAEAIVAALTSVGAPAERLSGEGAGTQQPLAANDTAEGRMMNRRVEIGFAHRPPAHAGPAAPGSGTTARSADFELRLEPARAFAGG